MFIFLPWVVSGLIENLVIEDDPRRLFHIIEFGYEEGGEFELVLKDFNLMVPHDYKHPPNEQYKVNFYLHASNSDSSLRLVDGECFHPDLKSAAVIPLASQANWKNFKFNMNIQQAGWHHLYFSNCEADTEASFEVLITEFNVERGTWRKVFLSTGEASLPTWYFIFCSVFVFLCSLWVAFIWNNWSRAKNIHVLMTLVIVLKIFTLFFEAHRYLSLKYRGRSDIWSVFFHIFEFMKGMMLFAVIVLIGSGWSYMKSYLTERDKQLMLVVLVVQLMVNVAMVVVGETAPGSVRWITWRGALHLLDMLCCVVILLPVVWSIQHLRSAVSVDGKAIRSVERLKHFRTFYLLVVSYVYFTRIIVYLVSALLPYSYTWLSPVFSETAAIIFYTTTGYLFRPQNPNAYYVTDEETSAAEVEALAL